MATLAIAEAVLYFWRQIAVRVAGPGLVGEVPYVEGSSAPVNPVGLRSLVAAEDVRPESCICRAEWTRADPEREYEPFDGDDIPASDYCPDHGVDRINASTRDEFIALVDQPWLWDESSILPQPSDPDLHRTLLYSFAGHSFGGIVIREKRGSADAGSPEADPIIMEQPAIRRYDGFHHDDARAQRPAAGVIDEIDLRPVGYNGRAFRYRHGRAWFESSQTHPEEVENAR